MKLNLMEIWKVPYLHQNMKLISWTLSTLKRTLNLKINGESGKEVTIEREKSEKKLIVTDVTILLNFEQR